MCPTLYREEEEQEEQEIDNTEDNKALNSMLGLEEK